MGRSAGVAVVGILAVAALGVGLFTVYNQLTVIPSTSSKVVGIWEQLDNNMEYSPFTTGDRFLLNASQNQIINTEYIAVSKSNTTFQLIKPGWYNIRVATLLLGISASSTYWVELYVDGSFAMYFDRYQTSSSPESSYYSINAELSVYSNGTSLIQIGLRSTGDVDFCSPTGSEDFNQLVIEYLSV